MTRTNNMPSLVFPKILETETITMKKTYNNYILKTVTDHNFKKNWQTNSE